TFGAVQNAVDLADVLGAECVTSQCGEQRVNLTPCQEHDTRQDQERVRAVTEVAQGNNTDTFEGKGDHHGLFTTDVIRDPAEQRTGNTVHDAVQHQCQGQSSHREEVHVNFEFLHAQVLSDNAQLSNCHHAAGYHADEHEEHQPEQLGRHCFFQRVVTAGLSQFCGSRNLTRFR